MTLSPDLVSLPDYERHARQILSPPVFAYLHGAAADGITRERNRTAFEALLLEGRVLAEMDGANTACTLLGVETSMPVVLAPVAFQKLAHPDGESGAAAAAALCRTIMTLSCQASTPLEEIAPLATAGAWFQLYFQRTRDLTLELVRRAEQAGYRALVVTLDASVNGVRNEEARAGFQLPADIRAVNLREAMTPVSRAAPGESPVFRGGLDTAPGWDDLAWLRAQTALPIVAKGIMHPDDAVRALDAGADAIAVSNHGGRTLDTLPATIEVLPRIAARVAGRAPVFLDGGIRRGTDIVKALALGAQAVMIGRPLVHALAVGGALGVAHMLTLLRVELETAMALCGCRDLTAIDRSVIFDQRSVAPPST